MPKKSYLFNDFSTGAGSYNLFEKAMRDAIEYDANISDLFDARVLTRPTLVTRNPGTKSFKIDNSKSQTFAFMARILGTNSPHRFLNDPCKIEDTQDAESRRKAFNLIQMHTKVFIQINSQTPLPGVGDFVQVRLERGTYGSFKTDKAEFTKILVSNAGVSGDDQIGKDCISLASSFEESDFKVRPLESYARIAPPSKADVDRFLNKLVASGHFNGFSQNFLFGLTANAIAESGLDPEAAGDPREDTAGGNENAIEATYKGKTKNWCSFGYWQLNVCPENAQGSAFIKYFELSRDDKKGILGALRLEEMQFEFVAQQMKKIFPNEHSNITISPYDAAHAITIQFENPSDPQNKAIQRGNLANELAGQK